MNTKCNGCKAICSLRGMDDSNFCSDCHYKHGCGECNSYDEV
jgi:hypothetical protein